MAPATAAHLLKKDWVSSFFKGKRGSVSLFFKRKRDSVSSFLKVKRFGFFLFKV